MLYTFGDWIQFYEDDNTNWGDVADIAKNDDRFKTKEKEVVRELLEEFNLEDDFLSVWSGYSKHENQIYKRSDKVIKSISMPKHLIGKVKEYQEENDLSSFSYAVYNLLNKGLNK